MNGQNEKTFSYVRPNEGGGREPLLYYCISAGHVHNKILRATCQGDLIFKEATADYENGNALVVRTDDLRF